MVLHLLDLQSEALPFGFDASAGLCEGRLGTLGGRVLEGHAPDLSDERRIPIDPPGTGRQRGGGGGQGREHVVGGAGEERRERHEQRAARREGGRVDWGQWGHRRRGPGADWARGGTHGRCGRLRRSLLGLGLGQGDLLTGIGVHDGKGAGCALRLGLGLRTLGRGQGHAAQGTDPRVCHEAQWSHPIEGLTHSHGVRHTHGRAQIVVCRRAALKLHLQGVEIAVHIVHGIRHLTPVVSADMDILALHSVLALVLLVQVAHPVRAEEQHPPLLLHEPVPEECGRDAVSGDREGLHAWHTDFNDVRLKGCEDVVAC
mmetsp:Transcript_35991/g.64389  ORF Transcript_35991/g.64389 Transcript_35991/m.64389 type:complete len:315 (+) Transcript_35991:2183-3127(+)